jgi:hypothetical protein
MVIEKKLNQETKTLADASRLMEQNNKRIADEARYYAELRRSQRKPVTKPKEEARKEPKEPYVVVKGFDVISGKMMAEDKSTGKTFPVRVLSDGPLALESRVMGFPPGPGQSMGAIRGPMKGPPIPPIETKKKKKKEVKEVDTLQYILNVYFVTK